MDATDNAAAGLLAAIAGDLEAVAGRVRASVVEVHARGHGAGAGTIWNADGTIVTNHHVAPGERVDVRLADGRTFAGRAVARDVENDLALFKIDAFGLPAAQAGDARRLRPGEIVLAIGHPFGVAGALTVGVVSAAHVDGNNRDLVRADVRLGPGNSGGPLADARGRVVGINAMVNGGMALAVPAHIVERLAARPARQRTLGVGVRDVVLSPVQAVAAGLDSALGALVTHLQPDGAAQRAGVLVGDTIVAVGDVRVEGATALASAIQTTAERTPALRIVRGSDARWLSVSLDEEITRHAA